MAAVESHERYSGAHASVRPDDAGGGRKASEHGRIKRPCHPCGSIGEPGIAVANSFMAGAIDSSVVSIHGIDDRTAKARESRGIARARCNAGYAEYMCLEILQIEIGKRCWIKGAVGRR